METSLCSQLTYEVRDVRMLGGVWSDAARRTTLKLFLTRSSEFLLSDEVCVLNQTTNCFCLFFYWSERTECLFGVFIFLFFNV